MVRIKRDEMTKICSGRLKAGSTKRGKHDQISLGWEESKAAGPSPLGLSFKVYLVVNENQGKRGQEGTFA